MVSTCRLSREEHVKLEQRIDTLEGRSRISAELTFVKINARCLSMLLEGNVNNLQGHWLVIGEVETLF